MLAKNVQQLANTVNLRLVSLKNITGNFIKVLQVIKDAQVSLAATGFGEMNSGISDMGTTAGFSDMGGSVIPPGSFSETF
jgi:hypothetical protein